MALKGDRNYTNDVSIDVFMNTTGEQGTFVIFSSGGSGAGMDDSNAVVVVPTGQEPSGTNPAGLLLYDVTTDDPTRQRAFYEKNSVVVGEKVAVVRRGEVTTDRIATGLTIVIGDKAYYDAYGDFTNAAPTNVTQAVGQFRTLQNANGYATIDIHF